MAIDTLEILRSVAAIDRVLLVGQGNDQARLARSYGCDYLDDDPALDISANLTRIVRLPEQSGAKALLYIPADLAFMTRQDVVRLLRGAKPGITICRAGRDGGTNVLLARPPGQLAFSFGAGSSGRHALAARAAKRRVRILDDAAFQQDIDTPEDLARLHLHGGRGNLVDYLEHSKLGARLAGILPERLA